MTAWWMLPLYFALIAAAVIQWRTGSTAASVVTDKLLILIVIALTAFAVATAAFALIDAL